MHVHVNYLNSNWQLIILIDSTVILNINFDGNKFNYFQNTTNQGI